MFIRQADTAFLFIVHDMYLERRKDDQVEAILKELPLGTRVVLGSEASSSADAPTNRRSSNRRTSADIENFEQTVWLWFAYVRDGLLMPPRDHRSAEVGGHGDMRSPQVGEVAMSGPRVRTPERSTPTG